MRPDEVQRLVLRAPPGTAVAHLILRIPEGLGRVAADLLHTKLSASFGVPLYDQPCCSIGVSFDGLVALGVPEAYLRLYRRLAPAFSDGAVRRSVRVGDSGPSAASNWNAKFAQASAHVLVSWHGPRADVDNAALELAGAWSKKLGTSQPEPLIGERLGAPKNEVGEWVHFGYRDGISEVSIDDTCSRPDASDCRKHKPGALLLTEINDAGFNLFALSRAPEKVRGFFRESSFGILRPMKQDLASFEEAIDRWVGETQAAVGSPVTRDFVKAKLCGRWPDGRMVKPGEYTPQGSSLQLDFSEDGAGEGCPFGSHVRRMRAAPDASGHAFERPLQRRSLPFGPAIWSGRPTDDKSRGLLGHFFCASIEDQFEHLLGQWAARPPVGFPAEASALDPLIGPHDDLDAALVVPHKGRPPQRLQGFRAWTTTQGTMYAWYPGQSGLKALLEDDFVPEDGEGPWL